MKLFSSRANFTLKWVWFRLEVGVAQFKPFSFPFIFSRKKGVAGMNMRATVEDFRQSPHIHDQSPAEHKDAVLIMIIATVLLEHFQCETCSISLNKFKCKKYKTPAYKTPKQHESKQTCTNIQLSYKGLKEKVYVPHTT